MQITIRHHLPLNASPQQVIDMLIQSRLKREQSNIDTSHYLSPPHPALLSLSDFGFDTAYIDQAMHLIWQCHPKHPQNKNPQKPVIVYTDYDADGITGGAILWETLHTLGFIAFPYTPNRMTEGYGFSTQGLDSIKAKYDPALIISVDHGITADMTVTYALETLGIPIIVTDHHHRQEEKVPKDAKAIFHIPSLSGSGTAYYVAKEIVNSTKFRVQNTKYGNLTPSIQHLETQFQNDYVGIAAIGIIADLVPLQGPSRNIAYHGLKALTNTQRPGLLVLKKVADHIGKTVTTYEVGFLLAPRINASGRLEDALDALRLLCTKDATKALALAEKLNNLNIQRQDMVKEAVEEALEIVEAQKDTDGNLPRILIVYQSHARPTKHTTQDHKHQVVDFWHEGIIGLIASKLCEKYYRPTIVLTPAEHNIRTNSALEMKNGHYYKASCRSIPDFHIMEYLTARKNLLVKFGGHEAAAGFSIDFDRLNEFVESSYQYANIKVTDEMLERTVTVDCELPLKFANLEFAEMLEKMAPFGMGNPKPVFMSGGKITNVRAIGKDQKHARFRLVQGTEGLDFVAFGKAEEILAKSKEYSDLGVVYTLDINRWNGSEKVQGKFIACSE